MGLFRRQPQPPDPALLPSLQEVATQAKLRAYRDGLGDGIEEALNQLEGKSDHQGPRVELTEELRDWIAFARANLDRTRAEYAQKGRLP
jgi:hypothetical protein